MQMLEYLAHQRQITVAHLRASLLVRHAPGRSNVCGASLPRAVLKYRPCIVVRMAVERFVNANPQIGMDSTGTCPKGHPWGTTPDCPWLTIQFSVDELAKLKGGTLHVESAQYVENVRMGAQHSNIRIVGVAGKVTSFVDAQFCEVRPLLTPKNKGQANITIDDASEVLIANMNLADGSCGAEANRAKHLRIVDCCIRDNDGPEGAGFRIVECEDASIWYCRVFNNKARGDGGGGFVDGGRRVVISNTRFFSNDAGNSGGAVHFHQVQGRVEVDGCRFGRDVLSNEKPNTALSGGALSFYGCEHLEIGLRSQNIFEFGKAFPAGGMVATGGAIAMSWCDAEIGADYFYDNQAQYGGAVGLRNNISVRIWGADLGMNQASESGGAIYSTSDSSPQLVKLVNCRIHLNTAQKAGGGVASEGNVVLIAINTRIYNGNSASTGGGLYFDGGPDHYQVKLGQCDFNDNHATGGDGGGCMIASAIAAIEEASFDKNEATGDGGGLAYAGVRGAKIELASSAFDGNEAANGGAAHITGASRGAVHDNRVTNNSGGFYFKSDLMTALGVLDNHFSNNKSGGVASDIVSDGDTSLPKMTQLELALDNAPVAGVIVK